MKEPKDEFPMVKALREHFESMTEEEKEAVMQKLIEGSKNSVGPTVGEYIEFLDKITP